jgi:hypothetical protein
VRRGRLFSFIYGFRSFEKLLHFEVTGAWLIFSELISLLGWHCSFVWVYSQILSVLFCLRVVFRSF